MHACANIVIMVTVANFLQADR